MTRKLDSQEPLLNAVARKLGHAAGTLANMTHILTTEPATRAPHSASKPEVLNSRSANSRSANSTSANAGSSNQKKSPARARQNRTPKPGHATRLKPAARAGTPSRKTTVRAKSNSRRKA